MPSRLATSLGYLIHVRGRAGRLRQLRRALTVRTGGFEGAGRDEAFRVVGSASLPIHPQKSGTGSLLETDTKEREGFTSLPFNRMSWDEVPTDIAYTPGSASQLRAWTL